MTTKKNGPKMPDAPPVSGAALPVDDPHAPPKAVYVEGLEAKYNIERSAAASIYELMYWAGYSEDDAVAVVVPEYLSAFQRNDGSVSRQSWVELATRIIRNAHPGLFVAKNVRAPGRSDTDNSGLGPQGARPHMKGCQRNKGMGYLDPTCPTCRSLATGEGELR